MKLIIDEIQRQTQEYFKHYGVMPNGVLMPKMYVFVLEEELKRNKFFEVQGDSPRCVEITGLKLIPVYDDKIRVFYAEGFKPVTEKIDIE